MGVLVVCQGFVCVSSHFAQDITSGNGHSRTRGVRFGRTGLLGHYRGVLDCGGPIIHYGQRVN